MQEQMQGHQWFQQKDGVFGYPFPLTPSSSNTGAANSHQESIPSGAPSPPPGSKLSPSILLIIVILSVLFFISTLLHLLVKFLIKNENESSSDTANSEASLQRQLHQLFHSPDTGLDRALIDALPLFTYEEVIGPKEPFDCAVCLTEFTYSDQLRLLPICGHAFHISCIDTWLLSNSTCPLCRGALLNPGLSSESPVLREPDYGDSGFSIARKRIQIEEVARQKGGFAVRLGKFRRMDAAGDVEARGESSCSKLDDGRRCYSMGSYQYVVGDADLRVPTLRPHHAPSIIVHEGYHQPCDDSGEGNRIGIGAKTDSYSVSKIWLWSKKEKFIIRGSPEAHMENPSSTWMHRTQGI